MHDAERMHVLYVKLCHAFSDESTEQTEKNICFKKQTNALHHLAVARRCLGRHPSCVVALSEVLVRRRRRFELCLRLIALQKACDLL